MRKTRLDRVNYKITVIVIISVFFLFTGVGYSVLQQKLDIYGRTTIVPQNNAVNVKGNSTYKWEILNSHKQEDSEYTIYNVILSVENLDEDISYYEVAFDVPESYNDTLSDVDGNLQKKYENGRLTLYVANGNEYVSHGDKIELKMQLAVIGDFNIENLTLNKKLAVHDR